MDFGDAIRTLWHRSGLGKEDYAAKIGGTRSHIINVLNGRWPGSLKVFEKCCAYAKITPESCFSLPPNSATQDEDTAALSVLRKGLDSDRYREYVLFAARYVREGLSSAKSARRRSAKSALGP